MRILLTCALGMTTGMMVEKMRIAAAEQGKDYKIWAVEKDSVEDYEGQFDVLLLGPQVAYAYNEMMKKYNENLPVAMIKPQDYGRMNGKNVLEMAENLVAQRNQNG